MDEEMMEKKLIDEAKMPNTKSKKTYITPKVNSEELIGFGAVCTGVKSGGRKSATGAPNFCKSGRLLS